MNTDVYRSSAMLALFAATVLAAGLMAMVGAKPAWAELNFTEAQNYPVGHYPTYPTDLTAADFDGDGTAADLAVAIPNSTTPDTLGNVAVFSNEDDGSFAAARNITAGISPSSVTSADFDRDGKEDLAVANGSNVSISLSNGDDTFQAAKYFPVGGSPAQVITGHFNDDAAVDLAVASLGSDAVSVLLGNGDGTFRAAKNFEVGDTPVSVTSGDFDGDGKTDLATADDPRNPASGNIADGVSVLLGNGDGTFKDAWRFSFPTGPDNHANPQQVVSGDFDGDGKADLAVANHGGGDIGGNGCCNPGYVRVLLSNGDGTFSEGSYLDNAPGMWRPDSLTTADFDQDGIADLAIAQETNPDRGVVAVSLGNGDGTFNEAGAFTADYYPTFVIAEDLNDDNYPDLAVANREAFDQGEPFTKVSVLLNIPPPGATTSTSGPSRTAGEPQPSFQLASSETNASLADSSVAAAGSTTRISVDPSGAQLSTSSSGSASISSDGRYVVFTSTSSDLVANDTNNRTDVFVRDRTTGTTRRVSVDGSGNQGNDTSAVPFISADGRFVTFTSRSTNLVANDTNNAQDVFVRDRDTDADGIFDEAGFVSTERVSVSSSGTQGNNIDWGIPRPSISSDGRYVAFSSRATNLVANDTNGTYDVFVRDRTMGTTQRMSVSSSQTQPDRGGFGPSISANGRYVAFTSRSTNLVSGDTNGAEDVFVRDLTTGTTRRVSVDNSGNQANGACNEFACEGSSVVSISSSGRYVAFNSAAFNLVANDTNELNDIFVRDRDTDADGVFDEMGAASTERANVVGCASQANRGGFSPSISSDGRYVTFNSQSTNLVSGDTNVSPDVFVRDQTTGTTQRVSVGSSGTQSHLGGGGSSISSDGRFAAFSSQALDLVANDTNGFTDVFLRELGDAPPQSGDCMAPITTRSHSPQPNAAGWNKEDVTVTLNATDDDSGVKEISYSINGGQLTTVQQSSVQIPITSEGETTISYYATDNASNVEEEHTFKVKLDKSAPSAPVITSPPNNSFDSDGAITISGTAEANSTVEVFEATASGDTSKDTTPVDANGTWTNTLSGVSNGSHTYKAKTKDAADNTSGFSNTRTVVVDKVKPIVSSTTPLAGATNVALGTNLTATFSEKMMASSIITPATTFKLYKVKSDGTQTQITNVAVSLSSDGLKATLDPFGAQTTTKLARNTKYKGELTTGTMDVAGNSLAQQKSWIFTTTS